MQALTGGRDKATNVGVGVRLCACDTGASFTVYSTVQYTPATCLLLAAIKVKNTTLAFLYACSIMCDINCLLTLFYIYAGVFIYTNIALPYLYLFPSK
jgi:hypothetical protein